MTDTTVRSASQSGAGVLELLRQFKDDQAAADRYAAACLEKAKAAEPVLKAFECPPRGRHAPAGAAVGYSGCDQGHHRDLGYADHQRVGGLQGSRSRRRRLGGRTAAQSRRHHLRQDGFDRIRLAPPRTYRQSLEFQAYAGWFILGLRGVCGGGDRSAGVGHADAGLGGQARRLQWRGRLQAEFRCHATHRRASFESIAGSRRVFARKVDDVALALSLIGGSSDSDRHGRPVPAFHVAVDTGVPPLAAPRLAIVRFAKWSRAEPEQQKLFEAAIAKLRSEGAVLEELGLAELDEANWAAIQHHPGQRGRAYFQRSRNALSRPHQRSSEIAGQVGNGHYGNRLSRRQGGAGKAEVNLRDAGLPASTRS